MAVVRALHDTDDALLSNHRNHGHFLTYSGDFTGLVAEVMGRQDGVCGGRGGSQHMAWRHFHSNGVQAGMTGIAVGLARAREMSGSPGIVAVIVGDGTLGEGLLYESMNLAAVWPAPVLFVVEHNGIAQTTDTADTIGGDILARGAAFGLSPRRVSDADPELWHVAEQAVAEVRATRRPGFLVIDTARLGPHSERDDLRPEAERAAIRARDPVARMGATLDPAERARLDAVAAALVKAVRRRQPDPRVPLCGRSDRRHDSSEVQRGRSYRPHQHRQSTWDLGVGTGRADHSAGRHALPHRVPIIAGRRSGSALPGCQGDKDSWLGAEGSAGRGTTGYDRIFRNGAG